VTYEYEVIQATDALDLPGQFDIVWEQGSSRIKWVSLQRI